MADWSQLPPELLPLIAKRLETRFDVLRFRSVCSSWRSSFPPILYPSPQYLPEKTKGEKDWTLLEDRVEDVEDITSLNGKFYAIEKNGRTIAVDQSLKVSFIEHVGSPPTDTSRKFLVQSGDNLLAVEMLFLVNSFGNVTDNVIGFRIFRLA
ncbi:hypothetical protein PTKIN_Ptkin02bG0219700 [Pterospermum kingtungense]